MPKFLKATYTNASGQIIAFGDGEYLINESDIHDYAWDYEVSKDYIDFEHELIEKTIPCTVIGNNKSELANRLFEVIDKDVREGTPGTLQVGDFKINGYFYGQEASTYSNTKIIRLNLKFVSTSYWYKEEARNFRAQVEDSFLDFDYDFDYDYKQSVDYSHITNHDYSASDFKMIIYGAEENTTDPKITINGHVYQVFATVAFGQKLIIDSMSKTIVRVDADGNETNMFAFRNKNSYIFEKIPSGTSEIEFINYDEEPLNLDIILYQRRSVPKWI